MPVATVRFPRISVIRVPLHGSVMDVQSPVIARAIEIVGLDGNEIASLSDRFSKRRQVVFMRQPLTPNGKSTIAHELPQLRHFRSERTPHNPADEGFADDECDVVISFPTADER